MFRSPVPGVTLWLVSTQAMKRPDAVKAQIWMGVSVENEGYTMRIDHLRRTDARVKFLSLEPLLGPLRKLNLRGID